MLPMQACADSTRCQPAPWGRGPGHLLRRAHTPAMCRQAFSTPFQPTCASAACQLLRYLLRAWARYRVRHGPCPQGTDLLEEVPEYLHRTWEEVQRRFRTLTRSIHTHGMMI